MRRRDALRALAMTAGLGVAGCSAVRAPSGTEATATTTRARLEEPLRAADIAEHGVPSTVCSEPVTPDFSINAIDDPVFGRDWASHDIESRYLRNGASGLPADDVVIGLLDGDRARAYPLVVVWYHEIVNDVFGVPVIVTYCSICRSGMVAKRRVDGEPAVFDVSGLLWQVPGEYAAAAEVEGSVFGATTSDPLASVRDGGNLVMVDSVTGSYWSQILAKAICGPLAETDLEIVPSTVTTWGEWRAEHPETEVLLPPPQSGLV